MKFLKGPMAFITATMFLNFAGLTIIIPVIPYIVERYTAHVGLYVGFIISVGSLCSFLAAPALGYVSDLVGRRPIILFGLLGGMLGYIIFGIGGALWVLFLGRIMDGLTGGDTTAMYAYVADTYKSHERTKNFGILGAAAGLGFMVGPAIGGLAAQWGLTMPLFVAAGLAFLNSCWGYFVLKESLKPQNRVKNFDLAHMNPFAQFQFVLRSPALRMLFIVTFIFFVGMVLQQSNFSVFLKGVLHFGPGNIAIVLTLVGLVDFAAEGYLTGLITPLLGEPSVLRIGTVITVIGMLMVAAVAFTASMPLLYLAVIFYSLGDGLFEPALTGLIADATESDMQGRVQGVNQSTQAVARVIAPLVSGLLYEAAAYLPYVAAAVLILGTLVLFRRARKPRRKTGC